MATVKLTEKPETESVGSDDKVVLVQGGALRLVKASKVRQGGAYGFSINEEGDLILTYEGDKPPNYAINAAGELVLTVGDGQTINLGRVVGQRGATGKAGVSPIIGENKNWWTWDADAGLFVDTGVAAYGSVEAYTAEKIERLTAAVAALEAGLTSGTMDNAALHLGFYLDEDGDLCQKED